MMTRTLQLGLAAMIALSMVVHGVENPNVGRPSFGPGSTVPSAQQPRRMITPTNPAGTSGNDIVTGNVGGMKYFRGVVPYGSSYYTANPLDAGRSSVDNFLRRSENPIVADRAPGLVQPYYEPERTTAKFVRPQDMVRAPASQTPTATPRSSNLVLSNSPQMLESQRRIRPLSADSREIEQLLTRQNLLAQQELPVRESKLLKERVTVEPAERLDTEQVNPLEQKPLEPTRPDVLPVTPEIQRQLEEAAERPLLPEQEVLSEFQKENQKAIEEQKSIRGERKPFTPEGFEQGPTTEEQQAAPQELPDAEMQARIAAQGREVLGDYNTYDALAQDRYAAYMATAENYIKEGKFYKAADVYELASIWRPKDSRGYLGKGFSLFAAGEYMSSSYYIARAIELEPALAAKSFDLPKMLGSRDVYENRLLELTEWQTKSNSGELAFLMAYVLQHDNKTDQAAEAIAKAQKAMPESAAVDALIKVITTEQ